MSQRANEHHLRRSIVVLPSGQKFMCSLDPGAPRRGRGVSYPPAWTIIHTSTAAHLRRSRRRGRRAAPRRWRPGGSFLGWSELDLAIGARHRA